MYQDSIDTFADKESTKCLVNFLLLFTPKYEVSKLHLVLKYLCGKCKLRLKCYSQICVEPLLKMSDSGYFLLIWWQTDKKQRVAMTHLFGQNCPNV